MGYACCAACLDRRPSTRLTEPQETADHRPGQVEHDLFLGRILLGRVAVRAGTSVGKEERLDDKGGDSEPFGVREGPRGHMVDLSKLDGRGRQQVESLCLDVCRTGRYLACGNGWEAHVHLNRSGTLGW